MDDGPNNLAENHRNNCQLSHQRRITPVPLLDRNFCHTPNPTEMKIFREFNFFLQIIRFGSLKRDNLKHLHNDCFGKHSPIVDPTIFTLHCLIVSSC